jgi:hypothetical protein
MEVRVVLPTATVKRFSAKEAWMGRARERFESLPKRDGTFGLVEQSTVKIVEGWRVENLGGEYGCLCTVGCPPSRVDFERFSRTRPKRRGGVVEAFPRVGAHPKRVVGFLEQRWMEVFGRPTIPWDPATRRAVLRHAFDTLDPFVKLHTEMKKRGLSH